MLGYLMRREKRKYHDSLEKLRFYYPLACPNKFFESVLIKVEEKLINEVQSEDLLAQEHHIVEPTITVADGKQAEDGIFQAMEVKEGG
jgi:hypothetical protein